MRQTIFLTNYTSILYKLPYKETLTFSFMALGKETLLQKSIETLEDYLSRLKKYNHQIHICGGRNSYSKTDSDATFHGSP